MNSDRIQLEQPLLGGDLPTLAKGQGTPASTNASSPDALTPPHLSIAQPNSSVAVSITVNSIGCPKECFLNECRVAQSPDTVAMLVQKGFVVNIESQAGAASNFPDSAYAAVGAKIVTRQVAFASDVVVKVRSLEESEISMLKVGAVVFSFVYPAQNKSLVDEMTSKKITLFAMDCVPRISRAQTFDALSSMANIAGYKAVVEAAHHFGRFLSGQMTAAGRIPPAKILIIGGGVAGLSACATAKSLGAIVRCFDTRPVVKQQVESLGGEFLEVKGVQLEEGTGGYAKEMSPDFIEAEMALFAQQCKEVDIVITTALIPGKTAPRLISKEMISSMKYGSVVVDLAAEMGGNIETTRAGELYISENGVTHIGYTDLPSRLPTQSSRLYANNITKLFLSFVDSKDNSNFLVDFDDEVCRGSIILKSGEWTWPPPRSVGPPLATAPRPTTAVIQKKPVSPFRKTLSSVVGITCGTLALVALNLLSQDKNFLSMVITFALAGMAGYQAVWGVTPALHTPLMSVTNAISGITAVGGLLMYAHDGGSLIAKTLSGLAILASFINICGGFLITKRMLEMFKRPSDPREHSYLYFIPAVAISGLYLWGKHVESKAVIEPLTYLAASLCCVGGVAGLASQKTARVGNSLGMIGVLTGVICTMGYLEMSGALLLQSVMLMGIGGIIGLVVGRVVQVTELPQTVAAFHSMVGLAAMVTSVAHHASRADNSGESLINLTAAILGAFIGGITLTGSIVAFLKLHAVISSRALCLPFKNLLNMTMLSLQVLMVVLFLQPSLVLGASASAGVVHSFGMFLLYSTSVLSMIMGFHLVGSVGGGDMPVCITVLNSYSGWALVAEGFMLNNTMLTVVGSLIGFSGGILSYIMCVAMNRSLANVLFGGYAQIAAIKKSGDKKQHRETSADEIVELIVNAKTVLIVPGYGMAVAKAQHSLAELARLCHKKNVNVKFAIHPVAGRMPGQMNVLLAEAGVPYDWVFEMDEVNAEFATADVALVIGANDITNSAAIEEPDCPIAGMPVLHVWEARHCVFMKRSMAAGYADLENPVFFKPNTLMLLGDAKATTEALQNKLKNYWDV